MSEFSPSLESLDPTYASELVHAPGYIQPHGVLLVLAEENFRIVQVSANTQEYLGRSPQDLLGLPLVEILGMGDLDRLRGCLEGHFEHLNPLDLTLTTTDPPRSLQGVLHRSPANQLILELEPAPTFLSSQNNFVDFYRLTKAPLQVIQKTHTFQELCDSMVVELQNITGFDRVMLYRFGADRHGQVIAEARRDHLEPMLGLCFPATDIPEPSARLFSLNLVRLIPDVEQQPVPLIALDRTAATEVDMSRCGLRGVMGCHRTYLHNMGARASLVVALMANQRLWGLVSCQHDTPHNLPYMVRTACEFMGQTLALELAAREGQEHLEQKLQVQLTQSQIIRAMGEDSDYLQVLQERRTSLLALAQATGFALYAEETWHTVGQVPPEWQLRALLKWLPDHLDAQGALVTHCLSQLYPPAQDFSHLISGLLALSVTQSRPQYLLWFRPELPQTVNWAGNPRLKKTQQQDGTVVLTPRASFAVWEELVRRQSQPWEAWIVEAVLATRSHLVSLLLRRADELAAFNLELQESNAQLDTFTYIASHDLREPLRGIHNYATFLLEDYGATLDAEGVDRLETLVRLSQRMEALINGLLRFSRLGRHYLQWSPLDWLDVFHQALDLLQLDPQDPQKTITLAADMAPAQGDRSLIIEVLMNLISNGLKYNDREQKQIEIGSVPLPPDRVVSDLPLSCFYVRDNGIGIRDRHQDAVFRIFKRLHGLNQYGGGTGVGLTIVKKIVEQHGGEIWLESIYGGGTTFYFTLPQASLSGDRPA